MIDAPLDIEELFPASVLDEPALVAIRLRNDLADGEETARASLAALPAHQADSLGRCLKRLGWWLPDDGQSIQERLIGWLFREDVTRLEVVNGEEFHRPETPQERIQQAVAGITSMATAVTIPAGSCLAVAGFVRSMLVRMNQGGMPLPLGQRYHRNGSPDDAAFDDSGIRFDGQCLSDALNAVATKLELPSGQMTWREPTGHPFTTERRARDDVRGMLGDWLRVLEREIQSRHELPSGWESNGTKWPENPIRNVEHLRAWLESWQRGLADARSTTSEYASPPESYLEDIRRELRNTRRAMKARGIAIPAGFDDNPADINGAEKQLELLTDGPQKPAGEEQPEANSEPPKPVETPVDGDPPIEAEFVFRKDGDGYFLKGFGEEGYVSASMAKGLHDLYWLVQTPGIGVPMMELDVRQGEKRTEGDERSRQPVADREAMEQLAAKRKQLLADIENIEPTDPSSDMERSELQAELDLLNNAVRGMAGLNGKPRDINNPLDKLRPKFIGRQVTAIAQIRKRNLQSLADHFEKTVTTESGGLLYSPAVPDLSWDTSGKK